MDDLTRQSDRILADARALRDDNRDGGRHRRLPAIGEGSAQLRRDFGKKKAKRIAMTALAIFIAVTTLGIVIDGIGIGGLMLFVILAAVVLGAMAYFPKMKVPQRADLNKGDVRQMVGRTELWLEAQRPALPAPAAGLIDQMGVQLDTLGMQLQGIDQNHPKAQEIRSLVGEQLPEMIDSYRRIPKNLRSESRAGATPDQQLTDSLARISGEIDSITRQLAEGSLDDLAIKHRYLDYKFGSGAETSPQLEHKP